MKLNKSKPFIERINSDEGIRFIQNGVAFNNGGKALGKIVDGKFTPFKSDETPGENKNDVNGVEQEQNAAEAEAEAEAESAVDETYLGNMDLAELKTYAKSHNVKFAGNIGADKLREKILEASA